MKATLARREDEMAALLAQAVRNPLSGYDPVHVLIVVVVVCGMVGVAVIVCRQTGVFPPPWLLQILWVCLAVVVGVVAILFLASLL